MSMASTLWRVMQIIEANRHVADQLDAAASTADAALSPVLAGMAVQRRTIAEQIYDQYLRDGRLRSAEAA
jgi:hypothetical protein